MGQPEKAKLIAGASTNGVVLQVDEAKRIWGITLVDWGKVFGCLITLYLFLGLLYGALLSIAVDVRQEEWLELPKKHFGPFEKVERALIDAVTRQPLLRKELNDDFLANLEQEASGDFSFRKFNRPRGCKDATVNGNNALVCDVEHDESDNRWTIYPWIADKGFDAADPNVLMPLCEFVSGDTAKFTTILDENGTYSLTACFNGIINSRIPT